MGDSRKRISEDEDDWDSFLVAHGLRHTRWAVYGPEYNKIKTVLSRHPELAEKGQFLQQVVDLYLEIDRVVAEAKNVDKEYVEYLKLKAKFEQ